MNSNNEDKPAFPSDEWEIVDNLSITSTPEQDTDPFSAQRALRSSLTEPSARKYEIYIAIAVHGSYSIDSRKEPVGHLGKGVSRHTFAISLRDALMGFGKYGYSSTIIPSTIEYDNIKVQELEGTRVAIINRNSSRTLSFSDILSLKQSFRK